MCQVRFEHACFFSFQRSPTHLQDSPGFNLSTLSGGSSGQDRPHSRSSQSKTPLFTIPENWDTLDTPDSAALNATSNNANDDGEESDDEESDSDSNSSCSGDEDESSGSECSGSSNSSTCSSADDDSDSSSGSSCCSEQVSNKNRLLFHKLHPRELIVFYFFFPQNCSKRRPMSTKTRREKSPGSSHSKRSAAPSSSTNLIKPSQQQQQQTLISEQRTTTTTTAVFEASCTSAGALFARTTTLTTTAVKLEASAIPQIPLALSQNVVAAVAAPSSSSSSATVKSPKNSHQMALKHTIPLNQLKSEPIYISQAESDANSSSSMPNLYPNLIQPQQRRSVFSKPLPPSKSHSSSSSSSSGSVPGSSSSRKEVRVRADSEILAKPLGSSAAEKLKFPAGKKSSEFRVKSGQSKNNSASSSSSSLISSSSSPSASISSSLSTGGTSIGDGRRGGNEKVRLIQNIYGLLCCVPVDQRNPTSARQRKAYLQYCVLLFYKPILFRKRLYSEVRYYGLFFLIIPNILYQFSDTKRLHWFVVFFHSTIFWDCQFFYVCAIPVVCFSSLFRSPTFGCPNSILLVVSRCLCSSEPCSIYLLSLPLFLLFESLTF